MDLYARLAQQALGRVFTDATPEEQSAYRKEAKIFYWSHMYGGNAMPVNPNDSDLTFTGDLPQMSGPIPTPWFFVKVSETLSINVSRIVKIRDYDDRGVYIFYGDDENADYDHLLGESAEVFREWNRHNTFDALQHYRERVKLRTQDTPE